MQEYLTFAMLERKTAGDSGLFSGYGATYNVDLVGDKILPGAFAQSIADRKGKVPIFANHSMEHWIGQTTSLAEDGKGLYLEGKLFLRTAGGQEAYGLLQDAASEDIRVGLSIGFIAKEWDWDGELRVLKSIDLWECSITPFPAQPKAFIQDVKSFERVLRFVNGMHTGKGRDFESVLQAVRPGRL